MNRCKHYPTDEEINEWGPFCGKNSDVSGGEPCTVEDEENCQWAQEDV